MAACQLAAVLLKSRLLPLEWVLANEPRFSTCIAGADFVIKMIVNEVCQGRRRIQRGECMSCSVSRVSTGRMMAMETEIQKLAGHCFPLACSRCCIPSSHKSTYWLLKKALEDAK